MGIRYVAAAAITGLSLVALSAPRAAYAEDAEDADALAAEGEELMSKGDYEHACPKLRESRKLKPALETLELLAECDDKAGNHASAWQEYNELIDRAKAAYANDVAQNAASRRDALAANLAKVTLAVPRTSKLTYTVELDGTVLSADRIGAELLLDAGTHHLKVTTNGGPETQMDTDFKVPGNMARSTVTIPLDRPPSEATVNNGGGTNGGGMTGGGQQVIVVQGGGGVVGPNGRPLDDGVVKKNNPAMIAIGSSMLGLGVVSLFTSIPFALASIGDSDYGTGAWAFFIGGLVGIGAGIPILVVGAIKRPVNEAGVPPAWAAAIPEVRVGAGSVMATWRF